MFNLFKKQETANYTPDQKIDDFENNFKKSMAELSPMQDEVLLTFNKNPPIPGYPATKDDLKSSHMFPHIGDDELGGFFMLYKVDLALYYKRVEILTRLNQTI